MTVEQITSVCSITLRWLRRGAFPMPRRKSNANPGRQALVALVHLPSSLSVLFIKPPLSLSLSLSISHIYYILTVVSPPSTSPDPLLLHVSSEKSRPPRDINLNTLSPFLKFAMNFYKDGSDSAFFSTLNNLSHFILWTD